MNNMIEVKNNDGDTRTVFRDIRVDTRIKTDVKIRNNRPDIFILDKKKNKITHIEVGITSQDSLQIVETEKIRKYDLLANELGLIYKCSRASMGVIMRAEMHEEPTPPLKEEKREEDGVKNLKPKNNTSLISQGGTDQ
ncbi:hypothetical protein CWI36_0247p0020 [Hamiltosporidium magnivora]|uniref:Uncharacterized protein n=1 Tax=Hamiltosporidium magnivora TaxID=148818 RepID=A0A4Q9LHU6_9MICR|nr:hypothetical protein CWI36_0247p0020 [Hamiltosporidium magnivora]